jgi:hypothetical protein
MGRWTIFAQYEVRDGQMVPFSTLGFTYRIDSGVLRLSA